MDETKLPPAQTFRLGEKVRMTVNLAQTMGLVNGVTGHIVGFCLQSMEGDWHPDWN